jgi:hypothetical protein
VTASGPAPAESSSVPHFLIVGSPRSGTTLVQRLAAELSGVQVTPETHFFAVFYDLELRRRSFPLRGHDINDVVSRYLQLPLTRSLAIDGQAVLDNLNGTCDSAWTLFGAIVRALAPTATLVGEKTPNHLRWWRPLSTADPELRFVVVVRDPRAVTASALEVPFGMDKAALLAVRWRADVREIQQASQQLGPERVLILQYEDVVVDPDTARSKLGQFLAANAPAVPIEAQPGAALFAPWEAGWKMQAMGPITKDRIRSWEQHLSGQQVAQIEAIAAHGMRSLGYQPQQMSGRWRRLRANTRAAELPLILRCATDRAGQQRRIAATRVA